MRYIGLLLGAVLLTGADSPPVERLVSGDALVDVTIDGEPLRLRIEPDAPGLPLVAPARARELGLKGGGMLSIGIGFRIGRERFYGRTESVKFGFAGAKPDGRRVGWLSRDYVSVADGSIGPAGLPEPVVRFQLRAARAGEQVLTLPLVGGSGVAGSLFGSWFASDSVVAIGATRVRLRFDPNHARTLATAPAAMALAKAYDGRMTAATGRQEIAFGIERPYRVMTLARPFVLGGLTLDRVGVRVTDEDVTGRIPEQGATTAEPDPDEVVVTARAKKPRPGSLILGADVLAACSAIVFDKPAKQVRLSCAP